MVYNLVIQNEDKTEMKEYPIDIDPLYRKENVADTLSVDHNGVVTIIRRIGVDTSVGESYILPYPIETTYESVIVELFSGINYIKLQDDNKTTISVTYILRNEFTETYATKVEVETRIEQSEQDITIAAEKTYFRKDDAEGKANKETLLSEINVCPEEVTINSNKINLNGVVTANQNFKILNDGSMEAKNGKFTGGKILLGDGTEDNPTLSITGNNSKKMWCTTGNLIMNNGGRITLQSGENNSQTLIGLADDVLPYSNSIICDCGFTCSNGEWAGFHAQRSQKQEDNTYKITGFIDSFTESEYSQLRNYKGTNYITHTTYENQVRSSQTYIDTANNIENYIRTVANSGGAAIHVSANGSATHIYATGIETPHVTQTSREEDKKNFEKLNNDEALKIILDTDIYRYNLKPEDDNEKKHLGFVIGKDFRYSKEITAERDGEEIGVDNYSMTSATYGAIQKLNEIIEKQQEQIDELKKQIETLKGGK